MNNHTPEERFWSRVKKGKPNECWEWTGGKHKKGYGALTVKYKEIQAHRFSYVLHKGPIPKGIYVCHSCDNPPCVNPDHLWLGTAKDNAQDKVKKGRHFHKYNTKEEIKASVKAYRQTKKYKTLQKKRRETTKYKIYQKAYKQTPKFKASQKAYMKTYHLKHKK